MAEKNYAILHCGSLALFPGLPTVQLLISWSMQKRREKVWSILSCEQRFVYLGRQGGEGSPIKKNAFHAGVLHFDQPFPPPFLHTASDLKLDGGKAWVRG